MSPQELRRQLAIRLPHKVVFLIPIVAVVVGEVAWCVTMTDGTFFYALDDAYIHLALATRIQTGLYGINPGEFATPSSSILWPLLLAAIPSSVPGWSALPLIINFLAVIVTASIFSAVLRMDEGISRFSALCLGCILLIALNLAGLVTCGMEHGLQAALTVAGAWALVQYERTGRVPAVLFIAIIIGPLVRYENLVISLPICIYLFAIGWRRSAILAFGSTVALLSLFSAFLFFHDRTFLPTSVLAKSNMLTIAPDTWLAQQPPLRFILTLFVNMWSNLQEPEAWVLLMLAIPLFLKSKRSSTPGERRLALVALTTIPLHLLLGKFGWLERYEIYIFAFVLMILIALYRNNLFQWLSLRAESPIFRWWPPVALVALTVFAFPMHLTMLRLIPTASAFSYTVELQIARFVKEYWGGPVGIQDLGVVSYVNRTYILDYWGLASKQALVERNKYPTDPQWMNKLAKMHQVRLAIIYCSNFPDHPNNWKLVGMLRVNSSIGPGEVFFYAIDPALAPLLHDQLRKFSTSLPKGPVMELH